MIDLAVRAAIVLSLAWAVSASLRRQPASMRAFVWAIAFGGVLLLPVASRVTPAWQVDLLQPPPRIQAPGAPDIRPDAMAAPPSARFGIERISDPLPATVAAAADPVKPEPLIDWWAAALSLYGVIAVALLGRIIASHVAIARVMAAARPAGAAWVALVDEIRLIRRIRREVDVRITDALNVPAVVGVFRPALLVPAESHDWDDDLRRAVALHELAHVARWDALAQLIEQIACAIYWFIPLAWYGARRAAALRERASDDEVIRAGMTGAAYAQQLLALLRGASGQPARIASLAMARPSRMRERVVAILDPVARREGLTMRTVAAAVVMSACAVAAIAAAAPAPADLLVLKPAPLDLPSASVLQPVHPGAPVDAPAPAAQPAMTAAEDQGQPAGVFCSDAETHQHIQGDHNGRKTLEIKLSGTGCSVHLKSDGRLTFNDDFTDITALEPRGFFRVDITERGGTRRQLEIESRNGGIERTWRVNGREQPFDAAARQWFAAFLIELDRRTAIGVDVRLPHLLRQGGTGAVLAETGRMSSDHARNVYYLRLNKTTQLSSADVTRVLQQAAGLTKSDHYANELIAAMAAHGLGDPAQRAAVTQLIGTMDSDHYRAESVEALVATGRPGSQELDFLVDMLGRMKSDHYKVQVLTKVLNRATLSAEQQARLAKAASDVESDHYAAEFLRTVLRARGAGSAVRQSVLDSALKIQSDHYRTETLSVLLENQELPEADLLRVIELAKPMSDHYESETLRKVVRHARVTERVRTEAIAAAEHLSSHYREEVRRSARR